MKKIELLSYDYLESMDENGLKEYIKTLEQYIYYQSGVIEQAWKFLFDKDLEGDIIVRR